MDQGITASSFRQPGSHGHVCDFRPMALRPRLSPGLPLSIDWLYQNKRAWFYQAREKQQQQSYNECLRRPGDHGRACARL
jgi:hypothetical protein